MEKYNEHHIVLPKEVAELPPKAQVEILQLVNGLRPVAEITVLEKFKEKMEPALEALRAQGFMTAAKQRERGIVEYYLSRDAHLAEEAVACSDARRFGELMGFPKSSIDAYVSRSEGTYISDQELEKKLGFPNEIFAVKFSKDFAKDEEEYLRKSYAVLLEQAPELIESMLPLEVDRAEFIRKVEAFVRGDEEQERATEGVNN